jgi:GT2 family glycosyltransferase
MVTVVLVHWNQPERCATTIDAFATQGMDVRFVVVDNGSDRAARRALIEGIERSGQAVELVSLGANRGFGPAANVGLRRFLASAPEVAGEWAAVAPHDAIPQPGALERLVSAAASVPGVGLASADVGDGHVPHVDPYFGGMTRPAAQDTGFEPADYVHGTLLIANRACLEDIGLFEESFFAYCEEADLGLRAREAGWGVGLVHGARVVNPGMRSGSPVADYLMHRNTLHLVRLWYGRYHAAIRLLIGISQLGRGLVQPSSRAWMFSAPGRFWGMVDFLRGRTGPPPARLVRRGADEIARFGDQHRPGTAHIDPVTGEASAVPAIGGGVRLLPRSHV